MNKRCVSDEDSEGAVLKSRPRGFDEQPLT